MIHKAGIYLYIYDFIKTFASNRKYEVLEWCRTIISINHMYRLSVQPAYPFWNENLGNH